MKILLAAAALAALVTSPAFAQTARQYPAESAWAASVPSDAVIDEGMIIGQDPDPNVRLELRRDYESINH
jgi:hypothetical protein